MVHGMTSPAPSALAVDFECARGQRVAGFSLVGIGICPRSFVAYERDKSAQHSGRAGARATFSQLVVVE